jgi:hypothetical protein
MEDAYLNLTNIIDENNGTLPDNIKIPTSDFDPEFNGCEPKGIPLEK